MVKYGEIPLEGGVCEIPVWLSRNDGAMETVEYIWVDIWCMLDWIIGLCHKTAEMHFLGMRCLTSEYTKWDAVVADGDEICENSNPLQGLTLEAQQGETGTYELKAELKMHASEILKEWKHWIFFWLLRGTEPWLPQRELGVRTIMPLIIAVFEIIAIFYIPIRAENAVKFELQS